MKVQFTNYTAKNYSQSQFDSKQSKNVSFKLNSYEHTEKGIEEAMQNWLKWNEFGKWLEESKKRVDAIINGSPESKDVIKKTGEQG